jgi:hypothetical protein
MQEPLRNSPKTLVACACDFVDQIAVEFDRRADAEG